MTVKNLLLYMLCVCALLLGCGGKGDVAGGTISDVDLEVAGTVVSPLGGVPAGEVVVRLFAVSDSSSVSADSVLCDGAGRYVFDSIPPGSYNLTVSADEGSAVRFGLLHAAGGTDAGIDTLRAPGGLGGSVEIAGGGSLLGVVVFVPGTSYLALCDDTGGYVISGIPPAADCAVAVNHYGYAPVVLSGFPIVSGRVTRIAPIRLTPNVVPAGLVAVYDSAIRRVNLSWEGLRGGDIAGYKVYRKDSSGTALDPVLVSGPQLLTDTVYSEVLDEMLFSQDDTVTFQYQVVAQNTAGNTTDYSDPVFVPVAIVRNDLDVPRLTFTTEFAGRTCVGGDSIRLEWGWSGAVDTLRLYFSVDGGRTFRNQLPAFVNDGFLRWQIPNVASDSACLRLVSRRDTVVFAVSDLFTIRSTQTENRVYNGDFSLGMDHWATSNAWFTPQVSPVALDGMMMLTVTIPCPDTIWQCQFFQSGIAFDPGKEYQIRFEAFAAAPRSLVVGAGMQDPPYRVYSERNVELSTTRCAYSMSFVMPADTGASNFSFMPGASTVPVFVDNVEIREIVP